MTEPTSSSPFINSANKQMYGKIPLQSWVGKVVSYEQQTEQLDEGWGWRYKVRILGDNSNIDQVEGGELSYALCILPTTAGSGAAFKLRSVRISQGDMVYGVFGGDGPRIILGVFPRTTKSAISSGKFGTLTGFYGSLNGNTGILSGEFNEQIGPETPDVTTLDPKTYNKSNKDDSSEKLNELGYDRNQDGEIDDTEKKLTPTRTAGNKEWKKEENNGAIVTAQLENILENSYDKSQVFVAGLDEKANRTNYETYATDAVNQALKQNLIDKSESKDMIRLIRKGKPDKALKILNPPEDE